VLQSELASVRNQPDRQWNAGRNRSGCRSSHGFTISIPEALSLGAALARPDPRLAGLLLYYGAFGLADSASRRLHGGEVDGLSPEDLAFYRDSYLARPEDRQDLRYDCLSAELGGLPPCFIGAVDLDPLRDDSLVLAEALRLAGVPHRLRVYHGVLHGFLHYSRMLPLAAAALAEGGHFITERLALREA
jgi:acetyl esterase